MKRYVYRGPAEPPARATASGDQNIIGIHGLGVSAKVFANGRAVSSMGPVHACPAWGCGPPPVGIFYRPPTTVPQYWVPPGTGATSAVPQPPPSSGTSLVVSNPYGTPISPAPSPTVPASTSPSLLNPGQTLAQQTGTPWDVGTWLGENTIFSSVPNWMVAGGGLLLALMFMKGGKR